MYNMCYNLLHLASRQPLIGSTVNDQLTVNVAHVVEEIPVILDDLILGTRTAKIGCGEFLPGRLGCSGDVLGTCSEVPLGALVEQSNGQGWRRSRASDRQAPIGLIAAMGGHASLANEGAVLPRKSLGEAEHHLDYFPLVADARHTS